MPRPPVLNLGVIGLTADWESGYASALARLRDRVRIATVYDAVAARARQAADRLQTRSAGGVRAALRTHGLNAVLLLESGWQRDWTLQLAAKSGHPVFIGRQVLRSLSSWRSLDEPFANDETMAVPECLLRYQPSLLRLRELIATQLGAARDVCFSLPRARQVVDPDLTLRELVNWFRSTFEIVNSCASVEDNPVPVDGPSAVLEAASRSGVKVRMQIEMSDAAKEDFSDVEERTNPFCTIACQSGQVTLFGPRTLQWSVGGENVSEELHSDRSATDVALDLFARRAAGGLIPVPALSDLCRAQQIADDVAAALS